MVSYEGIFFEGEARDKIISLEKTHLPIINDEIHCTFVYHPNYEDLYDELIGKEFEIEIVGYACNGKNSGFSIEIPDELKKYYKNTDSEHHNQLKKPHITVSVIKDTKPYFTKNLHFIDLPEKVKVVGKFGYWIKEKDKEYLSYNKMK